MNVKYQLSVWDLAYRFFTNWNLIHVLFQVKSSSFLAIPEVNELLDDINQVQNRSVTTFGMSPNGLCELIPPANDWGDCITLDQVSLLSLCP